MASAADRHSARGLCVAAHAPTAELRRAALEAGKADGAATPPRFLRERFDAARAAWKGTARTARI